jgi:hypothetical protein
MKKLSFWKYLVIMLVAWGLYAMGVHVFKFSQVFSALGSLLVYINMQLDLRSEEE